MEDEWSGWDVHTPAFDKKKKRYSGEKDRHRLRAHESASDAPRASKHAHKAKRKAHRLLASAPLETSEPGAEAAEGPPPAGKRSRKSALGIQDGTGVYVTVDKENIESMPKSFRRDVDIVYIGRGRAQGAPGEPRADQSPHDRVREKKKKKKQRRRREAAPCDAGLGAPGPPQPGPPLSAGPGGPVTPLPGAAPEKKPGRRKRKASHRQGGESPGTENSEGPQALPGPGAAEGRLKKRAKKRRRGSPAESAPPGLPASSGGRLLDSLEGSASSMEASATPREEEAQAGSEVPR